jgi:uncharacterized protein (TIGR02186 family)
MRRVRPVILLLALFFAPWLSLAAVSSDLVFDLSQREVAITTGFHGTKLVVFGATEGGGDVILAVRGPVHETRVRQKTRVLGIWLNTDSMTFADVPGYYAVFSSRPIEAILSDAERKSEQIGVDDLALVALDAGDEDPTEFRQALVSQRQRSSLFSAQTGGVQFLGGRLFRATLVLPANVPIGAYDVTAYLCRNGAVVARQTLPLNIFKAGVEARINNYASRHAVFYGLIAVMASAVAGWGGTLLFRSS